MKWIMALLLGFLVCVTLGLGFLTTPWGTRAVLGVADSWLDELTIDYKQGGLGSTVQLNALSWQQSNVNVSAKAIDLDIDWSCLWSFSVCVEQLKTGNIDVELSPGPKNDDDGADMSRITLPFYLSINNIELGALNLLVKEQLALSWLSLHSRFTFENTLDLAEFNIDTLKLDLLSNNSPQTGAEKADLSSWQYEPIQQIPINIPVLINIEKLQIAPLSLLSNGQTTVDLTSLLLSADVAQDMINLNVLDIVHEQGELNAKGELGLDGKLTHKLNAQFRYIAPQAGDVLVDFHSQGDLDKLTTRAEVTGLVNADLNISVTPSSADLPIDLDLTWQQLYWPLATEADATTQIRSPEGTFSLHGDLNGLMLEGDTQVSGQVLPKAKIELSGNLNRKRLLINELVANTLDGKIIAKGTVGFEQYLDVLTSLEFVHINPGVFNAAYQADINGQFQAALSNPKGQWRAELSELNINGQWRQLPLTMSGTAILDEKSNIVLNNIKVQNGDNHLSLDGQLNSEQQLDFKVKLDAPEVEQTIAEVQGSVKAEINLSGNLVQPSVQYSLQGKNLAFADILIDTLDGSGKVVWDDVKPVSIELNASQIKGINNQIDAFSLSLKGDAQSHQLILDTTSDKTNLSARISGTLQDHAWKGEWLEGKVDSTYVTLNLVDPFYISADWVEQSYSISPHCWRQVDSELCVKQAKFAGNHALWDVAMRDLMLIPLVQRVLPSFPPIESDSKLNMTMQGDWVLDGLPKATLHADLSPAKWRFKSDKKLGIELKVFMIDAQLSEQNVNLSAQISGPQIGALNLNLQGEAGNFDEQLERPINGTFTLSQFNLSPFKILLPTLDKFEGVIAGETAISGTLRKPLVNGTITLNEGAVRGQNIPLIISGVNQTLTLKGDGAVLSGSYLLGQGKGSVNGEIQWQPSLNGSIKVSGQQLEIDYQSMLRAQVSPNIEVNFSPDLVKVRGEVIVPYARFKLRELPQGSVSPSDDVVLVEQQTKEAQSAQIVDLNVLVSVDPNKRNDVKLDAFGLTTDVLGDMRLESSKLGMIANGDVQLVNGRYRAYGQNLVIRQGDIIFNGPLDRPYLNIEAVRDPKLTADDVIAGIRVDGSAKSPKVEVFSEPAMEQQQSLSYMLTGRGLGQSSGDSQDTMLTNMLLGFGLGQSENMVSNIGQKLGFKDLNLDTSGQGNNTQLSVSGYIAPGVQLRYGVGVFDSISEVAIRYELLPQLYVEAVSGVSNAIDLYYSFSIEGSQNEAAANE